MKAPVKFIIVGKFTRDGNGNPCITLPNSDLPYIDMEKEYIINIEGPCSEVIHTEIKNKNKVKSVIRAMPDNTTVFT